MRHFLLFNTSFKNKGDALMNAAVIKELGANCTWAIPASLAFLSARETKKYKVCLFSDLPGVSTKQRIFNAAVNIAAVILKVVPKKLLERSRFMLLDHVDVAFDVSGYCYGDHWGQSRIDRGELIYKKLSSNGSKIVLMPKTWGPFDVVSRSSVDSMLRYVDILFARDSTSKDLLDSFLTTGVAAKTFYAPDYTHRIEGNLASISHGINSKIGYLIPSYRVIDSGAMDRSSYMKLMSIARELFVAAGLDAKLLIHEVSNDLKFIDAIGEMGFSPSDVVVIDDPVDLKNVISGATAVVTSRLHGLYNALNSAVPVAVVAWSFKYREALVQYGCLDCLVDLVRPEASLREVVLSILDPERVKSLKEKMSEGKAISSEQTELMWARVRHVTEWDSNQCPH